MFSASDLDRFSAKWAQVGDCWQWNAFIDAHGYGRFSVGGRMRLAHRAAYEGYEGDPAVTIHAPVGTTVEAVDHD